VDFIVGKDTENKKMSFVVGNRNPVAQRVT
jgi:hypothetical protein